MVAVASRKRVASGVVWYFSPVHCIVQIPGGGGLRIKVRPAGEQVALLCFFAFFYDTMGPFFD